MIRGTIAASVAAARSSSREEIEEVEDDEGSDEEEDMHNNDYRQRENLFGRSWIWRMDVSHWKWRSLSVREIGRAHV